jgi:hypothetical protein
VTIKRSRFISAGIAMYIVATGAACAEVHVLAHGDLRVEIETATNRHMEEFGPRFDRTAIVRSVTVRGVEFLGAWGLCDEFGLYGNGVLGYDTAEIGGAFVKIGVGTLVRDSASGYHFAHPYPVRELFHVQAETGDKQFTIVQDSDPALPNRYRYRKTYTLGADNLLTIHYQLTNTGEHPWTFEHYNHHWFRFRGMEPGPAYQISSGFALPDAETQFQLAPNTLRMSTPLRKGEAAYYASDLPDAEADSNTLELSIDGNTIVRYAGSFRPARFALYASDAGFCPEIFKRSELQAGESVEWNATYRFTPPPHDHSGGR